MSQESWSFCESFQFSKIKRLVFVVVVVFKVCCRGRRERCHRFFKSPNPPRIWTPRGEPQFLALRCSDEMGDWLNPTWVLSPSTHLLLKETLFPVGSSMTVFPRFFFSLVGEGVTQLEIGHCLNSCILEAENWKWAHEGGALLRGILSSHLKRWVCSLCWDWGWGGRRWDPQEMRQRGSCRGWWAGLRSSLQVSSLPSRVQEPPAEL